MRLAHLLIFLLITSIPQPGDAEEKSIPTAEDVLTRSSAYHDPEGVFLTRPHRLHFRETRPEGPARYADVFIDVRGESFELVRRGEETITYRVDGEDCEALFNGKGDVRDEIREKHHLNCDRARLFRNYYTYLWGLPMKLRDPGTHLGPVNETSFQKKPAYGLKVTYDEEVGGDIWYVYFHPKTFAMLGYRFYHDEAKGDGEYIVLSDEVSDAGLRLPSRRTWYTHQGDKKLGTDILIAIEEVGP